MPTELLQAGNAVTIADTVIRALPARNCHMFLTAVTATSADISNDPTMANAKNLVAASDPAFASAGIDVAAGFIRINGGSATIRLTK